MAEKTEKEKKTATKTTTRAKAPAKAASTRAAAAKAPAPAKAPAKAAVAARPVGKRNNGVEDTSEVSASEAEEEKDRREQCHFEQGLATLRPLPAAIPPAGPAEQPAGRAAQQNDQRHGQAGDRCPVVDDLMEGVAENQQRESVAKGEIDQGGQRRICPPWHPEYWVQQDGSLSSPESDRAPPQARPSPLRVSTDAYNNL